MSQDKKEITNEIAENLHKIFHIDGVTDAITNWLAPLQMNDENVRNFVHDIKELLSTSVITKNENLENNICKALGFEKTALSLPFYVSPNDVKAIVEKIQDNDPILLFALGKFSLATQPNSLIGLIAFLACYLADDRKPYHFISDFGMVHAISIYIPFLSENIDLTKWLKNVQEYCAFSIAELMKPREIMVTDIISFHTETMYSFNHVQKYKEKLLTLFILASYIPQQYLISVLSAEEILLTTARERFSEKIKQWLENQSNVAMSNIENKGGKRKLTDDETQEEHEAIKKSKQEELCLFSNTIPKNKITPSTTIDFNIDNTEETFLQPSEKGKEKACTYPYYKK